MHFYHVYKALEIYIKIKLLRLFYAYCFFRILFGLYLIVPESLMHGLKLIDLLQQSLIYDFS